MTDDFDPFDPFDDPQLGRALGRLGGPSPDLGAAHDTFRRRARTARRRRTAAWTMSTAAVAALFVVAAAALPGGDGEGRIVPADPTGPTVDIDRSEPSSTVATPDGTTPDGTTPDGTVTVPNGTTGVTVDRASDGPEAGSLPATGDDDSDDDEADDDSDSASGTSPGTTKSSSSGSSSPSTPSTPSTTAHSSTNPPSTTSGATVTKTCSSPGGSLTARRQNGDLGIIGIAPASGWSVDEQEDEDDEVKVRFEDGTDARWEVKARWTGSAITCEVKNDG